MALHPVVTEHSRAVGADAATAYGLVADASRRPEWMGELRRVEAPAGLVGQGQRFTGYTSLLFHDFVGESEVRLAEPGARLVESVVIGARFTSEWTLTPAGEGGTLVGHRIEIDFPGGPFSWLERRVLRRRMATMQRRSLDHLASRLGEHMPDITVTTTVDAPPERVYELVADVTRMGEWSPECVRCEWLDAARTKFKGHNRRGIRRWSTTATVVENEPGRAFAFDVAYAGMPVARWSYRFEPAPGGSGGTLVTEAWEPHGTGPMKLIGRLGTGVADRAEHNRVGMEQTLARIKAAAERAG